MTHGVANLIYDRQGGPRGDRKTFTTSMLMMMGQRPLGGGTLGLRGMVSQTRCLGRAATRCCCKPVRPAMAGPL